MFRRNIYSVNLLKEQLFTLKILISNHIVILVRHPLGLSLFHTLCRRQVCQDFQNISILCQDKSEI